MARDAVQRLITNHSGQRYQLENVIQTLQGRIEALDMEVKRLGKALNGRSPAIGITSRNGNEEK
jgi:DNA anti-recombination protein RmuC